MYEKYRDRAAFYVVYIEEAHPIDAWQDDDNIKAKIFLHSTRTRKERCDVAGTCLVKLGIEYPAVVDDIANTTERAYTAWARPAVRDRSRRPHRLQVEAGSLWIPYRGCGSRARKAPAGFTTVREAVPFGDARGTGDPVDPWESPVGSKPPPAAPGLTKRYPTPGPYCSVGPLPSSIPASLKSLVASLDISASSVSAMVERVVLWLSSA
ncbi:MAG TPA: deiodinase-like protein [Terriglobia bacterium]|nr:deiodinase-like protein [Terriglobia bacterium]